MESASGSRSGGGGRGSRALVFLLASAGAAWAGPPEVVFRRIAVHGDQAPGTPAGVMFFDTFFETNFPSPPLIDPDGNVSFHAILTGPGINPTISGNSNALYKHGPGGLVLLGRQADPAPGISAPGVTFQGFPLGLGPLAASIAAGRTVFLGTLMGSGVTQDTQAGLWTDRSGAVELYIRAGDPVPGGPAGSLLQGAANGMIDGAGQIVFHASFRAPGQSPGLFVPSQEGVWSDRSGALERLVGGGDPAPGTAPGVTFGQGAFFAIDGAFRGWDLDGAGRIAFHGNLAGPGIDDLNDEGIWIEGAAGHALLIREGDGAPGFGPGGRIGIISGIDAFGSRFPLDLNEAGQMLFMARVDPPGGALSFAEGVYAVRGAGIELIAEGRDSTAPLAGPQAPGLAPGMFFRAFLWGNFSNAGRCALVAATTNLGGTIQGSGIWWDQPGPLTMLAANGVPVPGFPAGAVYLGNFQIGPIAGAGTLLWAATVGGAVPAQTVIFLTDSHGVPHPVLRPGQEINIAPAGAPPQMRTLSGFLVGAMAESGEMAFKALFNDNTIAVMTVSLGEGCYPDCNTDGALTVADFGCFQSRFVAGDPYADCNADGTLNVADFGCFQTRFVAGCP